LFMITDKWQPICFGGAEYKSAHEYLYIYYTYIILIIL